MAQIKLEIKGLDQFSKYLTDFPVRSKFLIKRAVNKALRTVERQAVIEAPISQGELRAKRRVIASEKGGVLGFYSKHAVPVHDGSRPHMPPIRKGMGLELWARKKGINPWAIAMSIKKKGTKANPFLDRAIIKTQASINSIFGNTLQALSFVT